MWLLAIAISTGILYALFQYLRFERCVSCHEPRVNPPYGKHKYHRDCALCGYCSIANTKAGQ